MGTKTARRKAAVKKVSARCDNCKSVETTIDAMRTVLATGLCPKCVSAALGDHS